MEIKYSDPEVFGFDVGADDGDEGRCNHIERVEVHPSVHIGGASVGRCCNRALPFMDKCYIHASRSGMAYMIRILAKEDKKRRESDEF